MKTATSLYQAAKMSPRRSPAGPEIRNPKSKIRSKSEFARMGEWNNREPPSFFPRGEQFPLLQYPRLIQFVVVALLLSLCIPHALAAAVGLALEVERALHEAGPGDATFDAARLYRLRALAREAATTGQVRALEKRLVEALASDASWPVKEDICRVLWQIGSAQSAPALKKLLAQPETVEIACYAVANNPVPELGQAAREALRGSTGKVAASLLNLLGQRRDNQAVGLMVPFLKDGAEVSAAAAAALGKIGSRPAVETLDQFRKSVPKDWRMMADDAYLRAVETLKPARAVPLWKRLVAARDESQLVRRVALLRLSEQAPETALSWLLAALREEDHALKPVAGQALRNLQDQTVRARLANNLPRLPASSQVIVVEALGRSLPVASLVALLRQPALRPSALRMLGAHREPPAAAALLAAALSPERTDDRPEIFRLLKNMPGAAATDALLQALPAAPAVVLSDLVKVLVAREARIPVSVILKRAREGDRPARLDAIRALRFAASASDHSALFELLTTAGEPEFHEAIEETIAGVFKCSGNVQQQTTWILARLEAGQRAEDRQALLRLLAGTGTSTALAKMLEQVRRGGADDREVAFRALTEWPNEAALAPLLEFAGTPLNEAQRDLALRGALRLLEESQLPAPRKADCFRRLAPLASGPASRKLLLSGLAKVPHAAALELIWPSLDDPAVRAEAAVAAIAVASNLGPGEDAVVQAAMNKVLAVVPDANLRSQALALLRAHSSAESAPPAPVATDEPGFTALFDGRTFAGWEGNRQVFRIQDGAIVGGSLEHPVAQNEFLCTTGAYANFELRLKFKLLGTDANGGVQLRSRRVPGNEVSGYQADLGQTYWGNLYDESRRNKILVQADQAELKKVLKPDDWNDYRIRCQGRRIQLWINGHPTVVYTEPEPNLEPTGIIGLQIHGGPPAEAWYTDIAIKRLD